MRFHKDVNKVFISADELSAYAFVKENHKRLAQKFGFSLETSSVLNDTAVKEYGISDERDFFICRILECDSEYSNAEVIRKNVPLEIQSDLKETAVAVDGYADIVSSSENIHTIEEIKILRKKRKRSDPFSDPRLFAKACVFAYITAQKNGEDKACIKLSYINASDGTKYTYKAFFSFSSLERFFCSLINRAEMFILLYAKRCSILPEVIKKMPCPYPSIRDGQTEFINAVYKSIKKNGKLMVSAPTGIGKTISALFPAVRAVGDGTADKIFYLTAKGVTGKAAADALRDMSEYVPDLHSVIISAKEQICPIKKVDPSVNLQLCCPSCEKSDSIYSEANGTFVSYKERELDALEKLLTSGNNIYTPGTIVETAREYNVCPYELSLDLSENCSVIICDYNYVIDDKIRLKRYFKNPENIEKKKEFKFMDMLEINKIHKYDDIKIAPGESVMLSFKNDHEMKKARLCLYVKTDTDNLAQYSIFAMTRDYVYDRHIEYPIAFNGTGGEISEIVKEMEFGEDWSYVEMTFSKANFSDVMLCGAYAEYI